MITFTFISYLLTLIVFESLSISINTIKYKCSKKIHRIVKDNEEWYVYYDVGLEQPQLNASNISKKIRLSDVDNNEVLIGV